MSEPEIYLQKVDNDFYKNKFIKFPYELHKDNPNWVPPLMFDVKNNIDTRRNPFYKHATIEMWLALKDGKIAGRIAAITNKAHNEFHKDKVGFFGFFECVNDKKVSRMLFEEAEKYLKQHKKDVMRGPVNPSTNDECGILTDAFDQPNVMLMPYNPEYYISLLEDYGFAKAKDLYAFNISKDVVKDEKMMSKLERISDMIQKKEKITIRNVNLKDFNNEVQRIREVYNNAWESNWGFVPMTEAEFMFIAKNLKPIADEDFIEFAEIDGKAIGFSLALPDINQVLIKMNGKLLPFGIFKFLSGRRKIDNLRVIIMGVKKEFQKKGIDAIFYKNIIKAGNRRGFRGAEISWVLEDNLAMKQTAEKLGAYVYKTYRIYDKKIN